LRALVGETDGSTIIRAEGKGAVENAEALGVTIAEQLLAQGAHRLDSAGQLGFFLVHRGE
jgi:hydroxymethylbilane synthase